MVSFNDMQYVAGNSSSSKKMEEEALLQKLIDKNTAQKNQEKALKEAMQQQKASDAKKFEGIKTKYQTEFKALEQVSKQLNVKVQDLTSNLIKDTLSSLTGTQKEVVQNLLKQDNLSLLKQEYSNYQLKNKGVEQEFSKEMKLMESIAKVLRMPVDQLRSTDVQKFMQTVQKSAASGHLGEEMIDQIAKEMGIPKEQISSKELKQLMSLFKQGAFIPKKTAVQPKVIQQKGGETKTDAKLDKLEARQEEIQTILDKLKGKQGDALNKLSNNNQESQKVLDKQVKTLEGKMGELEQNLQELKGQIKKTLNPEKKTQLEERKNELESQVKDLKGSLKGLQKQQGAKKSNMDQIRGKHEKASTPDAELKQIGTRLKELTNLEKELTTKLDKATNENQLSKIQEKLGSVTQEKEALSKHADQLNKDNIDKKPTKPLKNIPEKKVVAEKITVNDAVMKEVSSKLKLLEAELRFQEVFEKEINEQSSKDIKEKVSEIKTILKELVEVKDEFSKLKTLDDKQRLNSLKHLLKNVKNGQLKSKIESIVKQQFKAVELIEQMASGAKQEITDAEALLLSGTDIDDLSEEGLSNVLKAIGGKLDQLNISVKSMGALKQSMKNETKEMKDKREGLISTLKSIVGNRSKGSVGVKEIRALFNTGKLGQEAVEQLMNQFEDLQSTESQVQFVLLLRDLFGQDVNAFKMILSLLVKEGKIDESFAEEEFGVVLTKDGAFKGDPVKEQALDVLKSLTKLTPEMIANSEGLQQMIRKGRLDRKMFQKLFKQEVSEDAWDYGVVAFNKSNVGVLKERADINSFENFYNLMERFSNGNDDDAREIAELFLTCKNFSNYQRELVSFFISEFEEFFIDPDFHLFDLYQKYMDGSVYSQLLEDKREELALAVMLRMVKSFEGPGKHQKFSQLMGMSKLEEDSMEFIRSVEVLEYYFTNGGTVKDDFLDISKELRLFDNVTEWDEELQAEIDESTISKLVTGYRKPVKKVARVKLGKLSDRLKQKKK